MPECFLPGQLLYAIKVYIWVLQKKKKEGHINSNFFAVGRGCQILIESQSHKGLHLLFNK